MASTWRRQAFGALESMFDGTRYKGTPPRHLMDSDYDDFERAANARGRVPSLRTTQQVRKALRKNNPVRYARLRSDLRWARRVAMKNGIDPAMLYATLDD